MPKQETLDGQSKPLTLKEKLAMINSTVADINKKFKTDVVYKASEGSKKGKLHKRVIPTPSLELNDALYCGGFKGIVELFGPNSSGKTSLAIDTIAKNQKEDPDFIAAWLETEGSVTEEILIDHDVDLERLIYWKQEDVNNAENALDVMRSFIEKGVVDMIVLNSVAGLAPSTEIEEDLSKQNIALTARLLSKFFRVANAPLAKNNITMVFINQTRDKVGVMFGDPSTTTGGNAIGFYASQRIRMNMLKLQAGDPITMEQGVKIGFTVKKNRFSGRNNPFTKGEYYAIFGTGIDSVIPMPQMLLDKGVVRQSGAYWYYEDANGNPIVIDGVEGKFKSKKDFLDCIRNNEAWRNELTSKISMSHQQSTEEIQQAQRENEQNEAAMFDLSEDISEEQYEDEEDGS